MIQTTEMFLCKAVYILSMFIGLQGAYCFCSDIPKASFFHSSGLTVGKHSAAGPPAPLQLLRHKRGCKTGRPSELSAAVRQMDAVEGHIGEHVPYRPAKFGYKYFEAITQSLPRAFSRVLVGRFTNREIAR